MNYISLWWAVYNHCVNNDMTHAEAMTQATQAVEDAKSCIDYTAPVRPAAE